MKIIRLRQVQELTGLSESAIWRKKKSADFPKSFKLGERSVGWLLSDIENWISKIAGKNIEKGGRNKYSVPLTRKKQAGKRGKK